MRTPRFKNFHAKCNSFYLKEQRRVEVSMSVDRIFFLQLRRTPRKLDRLMYKNQKRNKLNIAPHRCVFLEAQTYVFTIHP